MTVHYGRNSLGEINAVNVTPAGGSSATGLISSVAWHPFGPPASITWSGGRTQLRPLDLAGKPTAVTDGTTDGVSADFTFGSTGNLIGLDVPATTPSMEIALDYDRLGRLTAFKDAPTNIVSESYSYDSTGNRLSFTNSGGTQA